LQRNWSIGRFAGDAESIAAPPPGLTSSKELLDPPAHRNRKVDRPLRRAMPKRLRLRRLT
jgi:hypothetical protein